MLEYPFPLFLDNLTMTHMIFFRFKYAFALKHFFIFETSQGNLGGKQAG